MDSSALPSEAQIQKLEYHALRTLARVHGLKATGKREEIRERLLQWRAEFGLERNLIGHDVDNEGAASSFGSNTKENVGAQETTARKRKAEEMDPKTAPQSKKILTESNILNTDVAPPTPSTPPPTTLSPPPSSPPSRPLPPLPSFSPPPPTSLTPPPPFPPQCPGIRQFPQPEWNAMFFIPDPSGWRCTVRPVSDWANASSEMDYSHTPDDNSDIE